MNEYFIKIQIVHKQDAPKTETFFVHDLSGAEACMKVREQIKRDYLPCNGTPRELWDMELLDIHRL